MSAVSAEPPSLPAPGPQRVLYLPQGGLGPHTAGPVSTAGPAPAPSCRKGPGGGELHRASQITGTHGLFKMPMRTLLIKTNSAKLNKSNN